MAIDWNQVTLNAQSRERERRDREAVEGITVKHKLSEDEAKWLAERRRQEAEAAEKAKHQAGLKTAEAYFRGKAEQARKGSDEERANVMDWAAGEISRGNWPVHRLVASDPGITAHQQTRTTLLFAGKTAQLKG